MKTEIPGYTQIIGFTWKKTTISFVLYENMQLLIDNIYIYY